ncbi:MAG: hypothetical protein PVS3B3_31510 [Ktedonobacteraceae bacterium]
MLLDPNIVFLLFVGAGIVGSIGFLLVRIAVRARKIRITTGVEGMIGVTVVARTPLLPEGRVNYGGENWAAILDDPSASAEPGAKLQIVSIEGLRLRVQPIGSILRDDFHAIQEMS